jgi:hypothetical protein
MPAGRKLTSFKQFALLIVIHPSGSGCGGTGQTPSGRVKQLKANLSDN